MVEAAIIVGYLFVGYFFIRWWVNDFLVDGEQASMPFIMTAHVMWIFIVVVTGVFYFLNWVAQHIPDMRKFYGVGRKLIA